ncbi:MAG: hypothetical protein Q4B47_06640 [Eubacteriales bacterium]|nr:hypothetical protein [Eubacteriales bacterium]
MTDSMHLIKEGFVKFFGDSSIWILYILAIVVLIYKKRKQDQDLIFKPLILMLLTIFNPLFAEMIVKIAGFENRYHRFLWILIYFIIIAYAMVSLIEQIKGIGKKVLCTVFCIILIIVFGNPCFFGQMYSYKPAENVYFTSDEILDISTLLHSEGKKEPLVLYSGWLINNYRTYDPSVKSFLPRSAYESFTSHTEEEMMKAPNVSKYIKALGSVYIYQNTEAVRPEVFRTIVEAYEIDYIVSKQGSVISQYLETTGLTVLGTTKSMIVWKVS